MTSGSKPQAGPSGPSAATASPDAKHQAPRTAVVVTALALLLGLQPIGTDLYLPALPALSAEFGGDMALTQLTLSGLLLSFGMGQLLMGPLSDRFGRRRILMAGLALYVLASLASLPAPTIEWLIACRAAQGLGVAASVVCARAMVRDLYHPIQGAAMLSKGLSGLGVIALVSPLVGGLLADSAGWRGALAVGGAFAAVTLALVIARLPETVTQPNLFALRPGPLLATWGRISRHPVFIAWGLLAALTFGGLFTFLASSSFVYIEVLGTTRTTYGLYLMSASGAYLVGTVMCRRWLQRHGITRTIAIGGAFSLAGGASMVGLSLAGMHQPWAICLPQMVFMVGHGIHQPIAQAAVAGPFPENAGAASALAGCVLALFSFGVGLWLGASMDGTVYPLTLTLGLFALLTATVAWTLVPRLANSRG